MKLKVWSVTFALILATAACEKKSPTAPEISGTTPGEAPMTDARTGSTTSAPTLVSPAPNKQFRNVDQPVTLTLSNGVTTSTAALTYTIEVATDSGFASKVYTKEVAQGGGGQTVQTLDRLGPGRVYFWRARSNVGGVAGPNSGVRSLEIGPEVILQTPTLAIPAHNTTVTGTTVTLTVNNVARTGPAAQVFYRFEVAATQSFANIIAVQTVAEQGGSTTSLSLPGSTTDGTFFWRVTATDPENGVTTSSSSVFQFQYIRFNLRSAIALDTGGDDFTTWPETTTISHLGMLSDGIRVDFDKKDGPNRWPDITPPGFSGEIYYCMGMAWNINGQWYASAPIEMWHGREYAGGEPQNYALNWFYNPARWAPMTFNQPNVGDIIGFFVTAGDTRGFNKHTRVQERSNVVLVPMPGSGGAEWDFTPTGQIIR